jgi:tetratricopeptide (TPR) repeat protein
LTADFGDVSNVTGARAYVFVLAREFKTALKGWEAAGRTAIDQRHELSARAAIRVMADDLIGAQDEMEKARQLLEERLRERPNEISSMTQLTWIYLALKRDSEAINLARKAADLLSPEKDALEGNILQAGLAEIKARTGAAGDAVAILRRLLSIPAGETVSIARLKIDPVWDPIRKDPGFQQLLTGKELIGPNK